MTDSDKTCDKCGARFEGEDAAKDLKEHRSAFHPAGAPAPVARLVPPGTTIAEGKDFGPAVSGLASEVGDVKADVADLGERVKALEDGTRSDVDLDRLADHLVERVQARVTAPAPAETAETSSTEEELSYRDLQARAKELEIPATGTRDELEAAIADAEAKQSGA